MQGIPPGSGQGWQSWGVLRDQGHHPTHSGSPGGMWPPHAAPVGLSRPLRVRDEQANPILIPDYVPREPLPEAGCRVAIGTGEPGMDHPSWSFRVSSNVSPL